MDRRLQAELFPVNLSSRWLPTNDIAPTGPWPKEAVSPTIANNIVRWIHAAALDMHCDVGLASVLTPWVACPNPADLLLWFEFAPQALILLERIRTAGDKPVDDRFFEGLPVISAIQSEEISGLHGVYLHYMVVELANGKEETRVYISKGAGRIPAIDDGPAMEKNPKLIGILGRW